MKNTSAPIQSSILGCIWNSAIYWYDEKKLKWSEKLRDFSQIYIQLSLANKTKLYCVSAH